MKKNTCLPPDFPQFCGKPHTPIPPYVPPVPTVLEGSDLYESMNILSQRVNTCIKEYNNAISETYGTLQNIYRAAQTNGSYYAPDEVYTEEKYSTKYSSAYTVVHKKCVDNYGAPIRMKMHIAYNDISNTGATEKIQEVSYNKIADKIVVSQPVQSTNQYYGIVFVNGKYISTYGDASLFTVGFSRDGSMHAYSNTISYEQLVKDEIENSMGCSGIVVENGEVTPSGMTKIPKYTQKIGRTLLGYNEINNDVIILTANKNTNEEGGNGLTAEEAANLILGEGATLAVEIGEDAGFIPLDKGSPLYTPDTYAWYEGSAFWYITRTDHYRNDYQCELGKLFQKYAQMYTGLIFAEKKILDLNAKVDQEIQDRINGDNALDTKFTGLINQINSKIDSLETSLNNQLLQLSKQVSSLTTSVNNIISGTTPLKYIKATDTNGNKIANNLNMNSHNLTGLNLNNMLSDRSSAVSTRFVENIVAYRSGSISSNIYLRNGYYIINGTNVEIGGALYPSSTSFTMHCLLPSDYSYLVNLCGKTFEFNKTVCLFSIYTLGFDPNIETKTINVTGSFASNTANNAPMLTLNFNCDVSSAHSIDNFKYNFMLDFKNLSAL